MKLEIQSGEKETDRPTFFTRAGDKELYKRPCDREDGLHRE